MTFLPFQFTSNIGYTTEVAAHWISSYFQSDPMHLPSTVEEAMAEAERGAAWMRKRFPDMLSWINESYSCSLDFWTCVPNTYLIIIILICHSAQLATSCRRSP